MYVEVVPNRGSPPAVLLREGWREDGKVRKHTLTNLSGWPMAKVQMLRRLLRDEPLVGRDDVYAPVRAIPHGHVVATLGVLRGLGLPRVLDPRASPERDRVVAMIVARILNPGSKLSCARGLADDGDGEWTTLAAETGLGATDENDLYAALDWLLERQEKIERKLARRHLGDGALALYDLTSAYLEGRACPLARRGYSRDQKRGKLQIEFGLLCDADGRPVAVEVFRGDVADPTTVGPQVAKLRERFGLRRLVLVGDRGMLTEARVREDVAPAGLDWISCLRAPAVRQLARSGAIQMSLFDERNLVELRSPEYPGERLIVCRNPALAARRAREREDLLAATEARLEKIAQATRRARRRLQGKERVALRVGRELHRHRMGKHFELEIEDDAFRYRRRNAAITAEAALDGLYVIRTSLPKKRMSAGEVARAYKSLSQVERAFRCMKTVDLKARPVFHYDADRVRAHVLLCMLAYYVEWHMRERWKPLLFSDRKPARRARGGFPVCSFADLLRALATLTRNRYEPLVEDMPPFETTTRPTPLQSEALRLLGVRLRCSQ